MDLNALMGAAAQDPNAAQFLQQLLSGGTGMLDRLPEIQRQELRAPDIMEMPQQAPLPVFQPAKDAVDGLLGQWAPPAGAGQPMLPPEAGGAPGAAPAAPGGLLGEMEGGIPPQGDITQQAIGLSPEQQQAQLGQGTLPPEDLTSLLGRMLGGGA